MILNCKLRFSGVEWWVSRVLSSVFGDVSPVWLH